MYQIDFNRPVHVFFIGIGGISMSGLAEILLDRGFKVSGSDRAVNELTEHLSEKGAIIFSAHDKSNIAEDCDLVVYTAAIRPDNPELKEAFAKKIPTLTRAELLGQLMTNYSSSIAVAGTHGKTTTTGMIAHVLMAAKTDPTISIGGILPDIDGNIRIGRSEYFLTEACEYTNSFLDLHPTVNVILNIEEDHMDFFKDMSDIRNSFKNFCGLLPENGTLIINADIDQYEFFTEDLKCTGISYSIEKEADLTASGITFDDFAMPSFNAVYKGQDLGRFTLSVPGLHNVSNALASVAVGIALSLDTEAVRKGLSAFTGTDRRFQVKGDFGGAKIIDDYAHHPTEIRATLNTAKNCPHKKLWCIFQPHTYSRTAAFLRDFSDALSLADEVVLAKIYAARETDNLNISSSDVAEIIAQGGTPVSYYETFEEIEDFLKERISPGDLVITMGAGDVYKIGEHLLGEV